MIEEPVSEVTVFAKINPRTVSKEDINIDLNAPTVKPKEVPTVIPNVTRPPQAEPVDLPSVEAITVEGPNPGAVNPANPIVTLVTPGNFNPTLPNINLTPGDVKLDPRLNLNPEVPELRELTINKPEAVNIIVNAPEAVTPVTFSLPAAERIRRASRSGFKFGPGDIVDDQTHQNREKPWIDTNKPTEKNIVITQEDGYISFWGNTTGKTEIPNSKIDVDFDYDITVKANVSNTRALLIDEIDSDYTPNFTYSGKLKLEGSELVGLDLQGTHTPLFRNTVNRNITYNSHEKIAEATIKNTGTIIGVFNDKGKQVAFGFNNVDSSSNNTRTVLINEGKKQEGEKGIYLNSPNSVGIQLRPEGYKNTGLDSPTEEEKNSVGLPAMYGNNKGTIEISATSNNSFGLMTVHKLNAAKEIVGLNDNVKKYTYNNKTINTVPGGIFGSLKDEKNMSGLENTGDILVKGTSSIGVGILHPIQSVKIGGNVVASGEKSVGVYTDVGTRPIKPGKMDDHGFENIGTTTVGTETVEVSGVVTASGKNSIAAYVTDTKDAITDTNSKKNYAASLKDYDRTNGTSLSKGNITIKSNAVLNIIGESATGVYTGGSFAPKIENGATINVNGSKAIGYTLASGIGGENAGIIDVKKPESAIDGEYRIGFYGEESSFTNATMGKIDVDGDKTFGVVLAGKGSSSSEPSFTNTGNIAVKNSGTGAYLIKGTFTNAAGGIIGVGEADKPGVGVYVNGETDTDVTTHINGKIIANHGSVGIYVGKKGKVAFDNVDSSLEINNSIGIYAKDLSALISNPLSKLKVKLGENSTLFYTEDNKPGKEFKIESSNFSIKKNATPNNITEIAIDENVGDGATILYGGLGAKIKVETGAKATIETGANATVLIGNNATIENKGEVITDTKVALAADTKAETDDPGNIRKSTITNSGTLTLKGDNAVGIYIKGLKAEAINTSGSGTIDLDKRNQIGMALKDGNSTSKLINAGAINVKEDNSIAMYGEKPQPDGFKNSGIINLVKTSSETPATTNTQNVAMLLQGKGKAENTGTININSKGSAGIYTAEKAAKVTLNNTGTIELGEQADTADVSAGIFASANEIDITNSGTINVKPKTLGIFLDKSRTETATITNSNKIEIAGGSDAKAIGIFAKSETYSDTNNIIKNTGAGIINVGKNATDSNIIGIKAEKFKVTNENGANININASNSVGIRATESTVLNEGDISINSNATRSIGIFADKVQNGEYVKNDANAHVRVDAGEAIGIYSEISEVGTGEDKKIVNLGDVSLDATGKNSAGIYSKITEKASNLNAVIENSNKLTISKESSKGIFLDTNNDNLTKNYAINKGDGVITVAGEKSIGMSVENKKSFREGATPRDLALINNGQIVLTGKNTIAMEGKNYTLFNEAVINSSNGADSAIGMYIDGGKAYNEGTDASITMGGKNSAGIFAKDNSTVTNKGTITLNNTGSAGIFSTATGENTPVVVNEGDGAINTTMDNSYGVYATAGSATNKATITTSGIKSIGMLFSGAKGTVTNDEKGRITIKGGESTGIYAQSTGNKKDVIVTNSGVIDLEAAKGIGVLSNKATTTNENAINIKKEESLGMVSIKGGESTNTGTITLGAGSTQVNGQIGIYASEETSIAKNLGTINIGDNATGGIGAFANDKGEVVNDKNSEKTGVINVKVESGKGIYVEGEGKASNKGTINLDSTVTKAIGIYARDIKDANIDNAKNTGEINVKASKGIGIYTETSGIGKKSGAKNEGNITIGADEAIGIYASNADTTTSATPESVNISNSGTISLKGDKTVGILASKSNITSIGNINFTDEATNASAVFLKDGAKAKTDTATIDLGKVSQSRVAYYIDGNGALEGTDIGKIKGYGVGAYLDGVTLSKDTTELDFTKHSSEDASYSGNGIIGLYLNGNTDISNYKKLIKVGNSVEEGNKKYNAVGIYANSQGIPSQTGIPGTSKQINANITVGEKGIGIYSDKKSFVKYDGTLNVGKAGVGLFVQKEAEIGDNARINLNGENAVAVILDENTIFKAGTSTIELFAPGVGVYGKKGAKFEIGSWTFRTNGHQGEVSRLEEGEVNISSNQQLEPNLVFSNVIKGEAKIGSGVTIKSVGVGNVTPGKNIVLMAQGHKTITGSLTDLELQNEGTIDLSNNDPAKPSVGLYALSSRANNVGTIKVGEKSTAIYGKYNTTLGTQVTLGTAEDSKLELGNEAVGIYADNVDTITNLGTIGRATGTNEAVGIYAENDKGNGKKTTLINNGAITLGDASIGIYSKANSMLRTTLTNNGVITVGEEIPATNSRKVGSAIGIYAENTDVTNSAKINLGKDAYAFIGENAEITHDAGTIDLSKGGVLGYFRNSKFKLTGTGNITNPTNTIAYLIDSEANVTTNADVKIGKGLVGLYLEGKSKLGGVRGFEVGEEAAAIFLKNITDTSGNVGTFVSGSDNPKTQIIVNGEKGNGVVAVNSNVENHSDLVLKGNSSVGIFMNSEDKTKDPNSLTNNGSINITGDKVRGIFLGDNNLANTGNIFVGDSSEPKKEEKRDPNVGIFANTSKDTTIKHEGDISVGKHSLGIYAIHSGDTGKVEIGNGKINIEDDGIGIYKQGGSIDITAGTMTIADHEGDSNSAPVGIYAKNVSKIKNELTEMTVGKNAFGIIIKNDAGVKTTYKNAPSTVKLDSGSTFIYADGETDITNSKTLSLAKVIDRKPEESSSRVIGIYATGKANIINEGNMEFSDGRGNIGIYASGNGSKATNKAIIKVGRTEDTDPTGEPLKNVTYSVGMMADNGAMLKNIGDIIVSGNKAVGMYGSGKGTEIINKGNIILDGSKATASDPIKVMTGVYVDNEATFTNEGIIKTADSYAGDEITGEYNTNVSGLIGVAVLNGSTLENKGKIYIDADHGYGVLIRGKANEDGTVTPATIINSGEIKVRGIGSIGVKWKNVSPEQIAELEKQINTELNLGAPVIYSGETGNAVRGNTSDKKELDNIKIMVENGKPKFTRNGVEVPESEVATIAAKLLPNKPTVLISDVGFYVDTLGGTKPIEYEGGVEVEPPANSRLIIGTEYAALTNKKQWIVEKDVIQPFLEQLGKKNFDLKVTSGSLTWIANPILDANDNIIGVAMSKIPYTDFVDKNSPIYGMLEELENRYSEIPVGAKEREIFNLMDGLGKNESRILAQTFEEIMGTEYSNVQQRIHLTSNILDNEFDSLRNDWSVKTNDSNKIKLFNTSGKYESKTAGIKDYKYESYGVAYLNEKEGERLVTDKGWYTGFVHNKFKFDDLGKSKEEMLMTRVGGYSAIPLDERKSANLTLSLEGFFGVNKLERNYLIINQRYNAKTKHYYSYGMAVNSELSKNIKVTDNTELKAFGGVKIEHGRFTDIKEKTGEFQLEIKRGAYYSIEPKVGVEHKYATAIGQSNVLSLRTKLEYETELGNVDRATNRARLKDGSVWYKLPSGKEDKKGSMKAQLSVGLENENYGVTANVGYNFKWKSATTGVNLRYKF